MKASVEEAANTDLEALKQYCQEKQNAIKARKEEVIKDHEQVLNERLMELAKEEDYMYQCCRKLGINE